MPSVERQQYNTLIEQEKAFWSDAARDSVREVKPDWNYIQRTPQHVTYKRRVEKVLSLVQPGWRVLEVGCMTGWLSLEMARKGAHVEGIDIADAAIEIARQYAAENPPAGSVTYRVADMNYEPLERGRYDLIVEVGALYHLVEVRAVLERFRQALRPSGILFLHDVLDAPPINALVAGGLMMLLPTQISYPDKFRHLLRLRGSTVGRMKDSIEAKGLTPFGGYGLREEGVSQQRPEVFIKESFDVISIEYESAFAGYVNAQLNLPPAGVVAVGRVISALDALAIRLRLLRGINYTIIARPRPW